MNGLTLYTLALTLFVDPLPVDRYWLWFCPLLLLLTGLGYKAVSAPEERQIPWLTLRFLLKSTGLMLLLGLIAWLATARV